jgi:hypothetical protein
MNNLVGFYGDTSVFFTSDYISSQLGASVATKNPAISNTFNVYATNSTPYTLLYTSTTPGISTFSYTVPDREMVYYETLTVTHPVYGVKTFDKIVQMYNLSSPLNNTAFSNPLPPNMLGTSNITWLKLMALLMTWFVLFVGCKATDYGIGAMLGSFTYTFMWYVNWIPHNQVPWIFPLMMIIASVSLKMFERRYA